MLACYVASTWIRIQIVSLDVQNDRYIVVTLVKRLMYPDNPSCVALRRT